MARKNPYDAPAIPLSVPGAGLSNLGSPPPDDQTEVALRRTRGKGAFPVDDETNFGDLEAAIGTAGDLEAEALKVDPRALAQRLAAVAEETTSATATTTRRPKPRSLAEDEPTTLGGPAPVVDPRELARLLAEQAKARLAPPTPAKPPEPPLDPAALARKLAQEAKARLQLDPKPSEDPAALARRLVQEAKARLTPQPAQGRAEAPPPRPVVSRSTPPPAAERERTPPPAPSRAASVTPPPAPSRAAAVTPPPAPSRAATVTPPPAPPRKGRLADRAPRAAATTSAQELVKRYTDAPADERQFAPPKRMRAPESAATQAYTEPADDIDEPAVLAAEPSDPLDPKPLPAPVDEPSAEISGPAPEPADTTHLAMLHELLPDAVVESERPVRRPSVFKALWEAHQARAVKDGHLELAGAATLLLDRVDRLDPGDLVGVKITRAGKGWAVFIDRRDGALLAIVPRPEVYLAGLQ